MDGTDGRAPRPSAAVYVRVSMVGRRDRESARYQTEQEQEERCRAFAVARGYDVLDVATDADVSGATWERTGLDRVLDLAATGKVKAVVVYRLSRLGRGLTRVLETADLIERSGATLLSVSEGIDRSTPAGRMLFNMLASFDEYERELRGEYWAVAQERASNRGVLLARTPFGYRRVDDGSLEPDPDAGPIVRELFERRVAGDTIASLCTWLDGVAPRPDGLVWRSSRVSQTLRLRTYLGEVTRSGQTWTDTHPPLVPVELFDQAQGLVVQRANASHLHDFVLGGLGIVQCSSCGGALTGSARGGGGRNTPVYRCHRVRGDGVRCLAPVVVVAHLLEPFVLAQWRARMERVRARLVNDGEPEVALAEAQAERRAAEGELRAWATDATARDQVGEELWREALEKRAVRRDRALDAVDAARGRLAASGADVSLDEVEGDRGLLRAALRGEIGAVLVAPAVDRRRRPIEERVSIRWTGGVE